MLLRLRLLLRPRLVRLLRRRKPCAGHRLGARRGRGGAAGHGLQRGGAATACCDGMHELVWDAGKLIGGEEGYAASLHAWREWNALAALHP